MFVASTQTTFTTFTIADSKISPFNSKRMSIYDCICHFLSGDFINSLNSRSIDAIARPIGEAAFGFGAGKFGGMLLGKAIGWAVGKVAGRGTQNAIQSTAHGVQRIAGTTATRGGVLSVNEVRVTKSVGKAFTQADGATVYLHEITPGRFNAVVEGRKGIITTMGNWSQKSINRIAKNYGWNIK